MGFTKYSFILFIFFILSRSSQAAIPERVGWWKFDNSSNLTKAEDGYGVALSLVGSHSAVSGPESGNGAVLIGVGSYYKMKHLISPNGGGSYVNEYSLQFDLKISQGNLWHSLFQTAMGNSNDGDLFINTSGNIGVGDVGYSSYSMITNEWYRLVVSIKNGTNFTCYLDGELLLAGNKQAIDGRFSLDSLLLIFADNDGDDANTYCSELSIWNKALTSDQAKELGGYGHIVGPVLMERIPYLQGLGMKTMNICWHDTAKSGTQVEYGTDLTLSQVMPGSSEIVTEPYRWHTVKLTELLPNTRYFYRVSSGNEKSGIFSFKTLPDTTFTGKIRFLILSDTHATDTTMAGKVLRAARSKITELYGTDIENHVNGIFHSGDIVVSGSSVEQYTNQYFKPISALSANLPAMVVAGNHEAENAILYKYLKLDDQSVFPQDVALNEKIWNVKVGNSVFIGLNTNIVSQYGEIEANWLDSKLKETEKDTTIDFVFLFFHHPPFSEMWYDVNSYDGGANYVKNKLFPIIKKYTKVQQLHYGHTHGFERGTIQSGMIDGDFRIICGGGGGGPVDAWGEYANFDYPDIHIAYDHNFFQILEIDIANHSYQNSMFSLGNKNKPRYSELLDKWYKKMDQTGPDTPTIENIVVTENNIQFNTSKFSGIDSLMSVQFQLVDSVLGTKILMDSIIHWKDIYNIDYNYNPVDRNRNINLNQINIRKSVFSNNKTYYFHVRYRDHNLKWSKWSSLVQFTTLGMNDIIGNSNDNPLYQNYPNPFYNTTTIKYRINEKTEVKFRIYDANYRIVSEVHEGIKYPGFYEINFSDENLSRGVYLYQMITRNFCGTKKMIKQSSNCIIK